MVAGDSLESEMRSFRTGAYKIINTSRPRSATNKQLRSTSRRRYVIETTSRLYTVVHMAAVKVKQDRRAPPLYAF